MLAVVCGLVVAGVWSVVAQHGRRGADFAEPAAREALARVGFSPRGDATVTPEGEHERAWALERARPGPAGRELGSGEGGARRWLVVFAGGGEARLTDGGLLWSLRRPLPTDPGAPLYRPLSGEALREALGRFVADAPAWTLEQVQTWQEEGTTWYRGWFVGDAGDLPRGWRREADVEIAGATVIAFSRHVQPLGTDLGVVWGRTRELERLRLPALAGLGLVVLAMLVTGVTAVAAHRPVAWAEGGATAAVVAGLGLAAGLDVASWSGQALAIGALVALLPPDMRGAWRGCGLGAAAGVVLAALALGARVLVLGTGGFVPATPVLPADATCQALLLAAWLPALVEEPVLRGAIPAMVRPWLGWWAAALLGVPIGVLLHPLPAVPLAAGLGIELVVQLGLVGVAWKGGLVAAVMARGVLSSLWLRPGFPLGWQWDLAALAGLLVGGACLVFARRR